MKKLPVTAVALILAVATLAAQEEQTVLQQELPSTVQEEQVALQQELPSTVQEAWVAELPKFCISASLPILGRINRQMQLCYPLQADVSYRIGKSAVYLGVIGQYASREDRLVISLDHYSDDNDQQIAVLLGTCGLRAEMVEDMIELQLTAGCGIGYHIMKYGDVYPDKAVFYLHLSHWWVIKMNDSFSFKIAPLLSNITWSPKDVGAAYSRHPILLGTCSFGIEYKFN